MGVDLTKYGLVVGGNRGIGLEVVRQLVDAGKPVIFTSRDAASGESARRHRSFDSKQCRKGWKASASFRMGLSDARLLRQPCGT